MDPRLDYDSDQDQDLPQFVSSINEQHQESHHVVDITHQSNHLIKQGDIQAAILLLSDALITEPNSYILHGNRSAAYAKAGQFERALQDAIRARELNPCWAKAYYRQGIALQGIGRHADALAAFASGLSQDSKSVRLLVAFVETAMKSPFRASLEPIYRQLHSMQLDKSPFVVTSVVGQELLADKHLHAAVVVLESSLRIGTCSMKLRGSVYSALSTAYWELGETEKALQFMQSDLQVCKSLGDQNGECRAHANLGAAYFSSGAFKESLASHRSQLVLSMKGKQTEEAASALNALGHVYTALGDLSNALASHRQCLQLVRQMNDRSRECSEKGNIAAVLISLGDHEKAIETLEQHLSLAVAANMKTEEMKAYSNFASLYQGKGQFEKAVHYHELLLRTAQEVGDKGMECRSYAGLGHAARCLGDIGQAKRWYTRQLETALSARDRMNEGRACSNLGSLYQVMSDFDGALKLHWAHLQVAKELSDASGMGRAYANIGACYSSLNQFDEAFKFKSFILNNSLKKSKSICST